MKASELKIESQARRVRVQQDQAQTQEDKFLTEKRAFNRTPMIVAEGSAQLFLFIPREGPFQDKIFLPSPVVLKQLQDLGIEGVSEFTVFVAQTLTGLFGIIPVSVYQNSWTDSQYETVLEGQKGWGKMTPNMEKQEYIWLKWLIDKEPSWFGSFDEMLDTITEDLIISDMDHPAVVAALNGGVTI